MNRVSQRYSKCQTLILRGATAGECAAASAAAYRMWCRHEILRRNDIFTGIDGHRHEILRVLYATWDNQRNTFAAGTDTLEMFWSLSGFDHRELRAALQILRARRTAGYVNGQYRGPKINSIESDLKMLNVLEWPLKKALRVSEIAEFGEEL